MCMKSESCELNERVNAIDKRVDGIDQQLTRLVAPNSADFIIDSWSKADINKAVNEYNAKLPTPPMTNGIPRALAEARQRVYNDRVAESNLTVEVTAGK